MYQVHVSMLLAFTLLVVVSFTSLCVVAGLFVFHLLFGYFI